MKTFLLLLCMSVMTAQAQTVRITEIGVDANGRIKITVDGPAGEYLIESTEDLSSENNWGTLCRRGSEGAGLEVTEAIEPDALVKFYRIKLFPTADGFHLTGAFAQELEATLNYANLQSVFGLNFIEAEAVIPAASDLSWAARNARAYAATIAVLSKLAQDIRDSFAPGTEPSTAQIVAALKKDLTDGSLDGQAAGVAVLIGTSGETLTSHSDLDIANRLIQIQSDMPGLDNIVFALAGDGAFQAGAPSEWGNFYWDSSDWQ